MEANLSNLTSSYFLPPRSNSAAHDNPRNHHGNSHSNNSASHETISISQQAQLAYSQFQTRDTSIEILTRDGDKVTINLSISSSFQSSLSYSDVKTQNTRQTDLSLSASKQSSLQYNLNIEGNIDATEQEAIDKLVHNISEIADELYKGDIKSALKEASSLEYDTDELQSYNFNLTQVNNRQYTAAYEQVARLSQDNLSKTNQPLDTTDLIDRLKELAENSVKNLKAFLETEQIESLISKTSDFLAHPFKTSSDNHKNLFEELGIFTFNEKDDD